MPRPLIYLVLLTLTLSCVRVRTSYEPARSRQPAHSITSSAVRFYETELTDVANAGGYLIGYMDASGNGFTNFSSLLRKVKLKAAHAGGTHIILTAKDIEQEFAQIAPGTINTSCYGNTCTGTFTDPKYVAIEKPKARYAVIRVPCNNWHKLPEELTPTPIDPETTRCVERGRAEYETAKAPLPRPKEKPKKQLSKAEMQRWRENPKSPEIGATLIESRAICEFQGGILRENEVEGGTKVICNIDGAATFVAFIVGTEGDIGNVKTIHEGGDISTWRLQLEEEQGPAQETSIEDGYRYWKWVKPGFWLILASHSRGIALTQIRVMEENHEPRSKDFGSGLESNP